MFLDCFVPRNDGGGAWLLRCAYFAGYSVKIADQVRNDGGYAAAFCPNGIDVLLNLFTNRTHFIQL